MLGELIAEESGKRGVRRVLDVNGSATVEVSFEADGTLLGVQEHSIVTYHSSVRPDGSLYGEGEGVMATPDGAIVTWKGAGVGKFGEGGTLSYRGAIFFYTSSAKFSKLNTTAGIFEFEVAANGDTHSKVWAWT